MRVPKLNGIQRKFLIAATMCVAGQLAHANPVGPTVVNGQATFAAQGPLLSVTNTPGAIINWQQFSIANNETTRFIQQSAASAVLNRVVGVDPSKILGTLQSNGRVFLINPNGILFGANAQIDVAGLVASTLNLSNADFIAGRLNFVGDPARAAAIVNQGNITAREGGGVYLIGSAVDNQGVITAPNGDIVLAAGKSVRLTEGATPGVQVEITAPADSTINLTELAYGGSGIYSGLVKNSGVVNADSAVRGADGSIILKASNGVTLESGSRVSANGQDGGRIVVDAQQGTAAVSGSVEAVGSAGHGGSIAMVGEQTGLFDGAHVDASGANAGGTVLIGGDLHGAAIRDGNLALTNSQRTFVATNADIRADALESGNGGKVIVWADDTTRYFGTISARGGAQSGDGGFVETSGKIWLDFQGKVDTTAPFGKMGTLLLDPTNIFIALNQANATTAGMSGTDTSANTGSGGNPNTFAGAGAIQDSLLTTGNLDTALATANVIVTTTNASGTGVGNITVVDPVAWASANTLTLTASNNISINAGITTGAAGSALILNAAGNVTQSAVIAGSGGLTQNGAGTVTLSQANTYTDATNVNAGALTLSGANGSATSSAFTVNAGTTLKLDNSGTNNTNRLGDALALTMNGGEFVVIGNAAANTTESIGTLTLNSGYSTITLTPDAAKNTQVTFASLSRSAGATALFRGINLGANTVASQTANNSNIVFTAAPTLTGAGGNSGTTTVSIIAGAIGAGGASGDTSSGTDFVTYNPPTGAVNGLRPLLASEYTAVIALNVNLKLTSSSSTNVNATINSLLLSGGVTFDYAGANARTVTLGGAALSGNVLSIGGTNTIQPTRNPGGNVIFGTREANIFAVTDLTFGSQAPITGSGGLTKSGAGVLLENRSVAISGGGGLNVNAGTLRSGINSAFSTAQPLTVSAGGTFDLNGFTNSITTLTLESGASSGANVTSGAGILTLGGNVTLNVNGSGATGATIGANLALGGANRTFTVGDGTATDDLTVSGVISGARAIIKSGAGTLALTGANTYTLTTTVNQGTLSFDSIADRNGTASSLGAPTTVGNGTIALAGGATLQYTGTGHSSNRIINLTSSGGIVDASGSGALTLSGGVTGNTQNLTLTGTGSGTESGVISTTTGTLTKNGTGTWTLSGANSYTGASTINLGVIDVQNNTALGTVAGGSTVASGAAIQIDGSGLLIAEPITSLIGTGPASGGALENLTNNNTWSGAITLGAGGARINSDGGTLTLSNNITGATQPLTVGGAGNTTISGVIGTTSGTLTKDGAGTLTLSNANTYTGLTTVSAGVIDVQNNTALGTTAGATTVASGAAIQIDGSGLVIAEPLNTLIGAGPASGGALENLANSNTWSGAITLGAAGARINSDGGTLTLSGAIGGATQPLTVGGAGDTTISGVISTTTGTLTKDGAGTLTLSNANTYTNLTTVSAGTLIASNNNALGTTATGTTVANNATLEIANGIAIGAETLNVSGAGVGSNGALVVTSGSGSLAGAVTLGASASIGGNGSLTLSGTVNDIAAGTSTLTQVGSGTLTFSSTVGATNALAAVTTSSGQTTAINGGSVRTTGAQTYGGSITSSGATTLTSTGGGNITANNSGNNFTGDLILSTSGSASIINSSALSLGASSVGTLTAQTLAGNLTLNGTITASGGGDSIVLAAAQDFVNNVGSSALNPGAGRWLVYSTSPTGSTENGLTAAAGSTLPRLYNRTYAGNPPASISESGNHLIYSAQPALTVTPDNKSKVYGTNDPLPQTYVATGYVNDDGVTDTATTAGLTGSFGRVAGETVAASPYNITQGTFSSGAGYSISFTTGHTLSITAAALTGTIANQTKVYGADDPLLSGITVTLGGVVNRTVSDWNGNATGINDTGNVTDALASLTRNPGETVAGSTYAITGATFAALGGPAANNYGAPSSLSGSPNLAITKAGALTGTIANQMKVYGSSDPLAGTIPVSLSGQVNAIVNDWNGNVTAINDTTAGKVTATLASITRNAGENAGSYNYTGGVLNPLGGSSSGNYIGANFNPGASLLDITPAALSVTANNQSKLFGNTFIFTGNEFTPTGLKNSETIGSVTLASAGAPAPAPVGPYPIIASAATGGTFTASNYNISYVNGLMTVTSTTPPPPPQPTVDNLDGLINPILVGLQSLGIGVPLSEGSFNCGDGDNNFGIVVDDGVAVSVPHRCVPAIPD